MKFSGKIWFIIILKVTNRRGSTFSLGDTLLEKSRGHINPPTFLALLKEEKVTRKKCREKNLATFGTFSSRGNLFSDLIRQLIPTTIDLSKKYFPFLVFSWKILVSE